MYLLGFVFQYECDQTFSQAAIRFHIMVTEFYGVTIFRPCPCLQPLCVSDWP